MRNKMYYRNMREKHIARKKRIVSHWNWFQNGYYKYDGMYSKNKIHCSCSLCRPEGLSIKDRRNSIKMRSDTTI